MEEVYVSAWVVAAAGTFVSVLLAIIAYFLSGILKQFYSLNETVIKIDKDFTKEVGILKEQCNSLGEKIEQTDELWGRMRANETSITEIRSGCFLQRCNPK